ncbi:hypothetical protein ACROSR_01860 [Roseovarius tibetensis]
MNAIFDIEIKLVKTGIKIAIIITENIIDLARTINLEGLRNVSNIGGAVKSSISTPFKNTSISSRIPQVVR